MHTLGQPEFFLHFTPDLIDTQGHEANEGTQAFIRTFVEAYARWAHRLCA